MEYKSIRPPSKFILAAKIVIELLEQENIEIPNMVGMSLPEFRQLVNEYKERCAFVDRLVEEKKKAVVSRNLTGQKGWDYTQRIVNSIKATHGENNPFIKKLNERLIM